MNTTFIGMGKHPCNNEMASVKCSADVIFNNTWVLIDQPILKINREQSTGEESIGQSQLVVNLGNKAISSSKVVVKWCLIFL